MNYMYILIQKLLECLQSLSLCCSHVLKHLLLMVEHVLIKKESQVSYLDSYVQRMVKKTFTKKLLFLP